jgi:trans-aconitate 2-methyltransferase
VQASESSPGREWNAGVYHRVSGPQLEWGLKVLNRLTLRGDETVLDAGCGTGRLTAELLRRLPHGRVVALDVSQNMLRTAEEFLKPEFGERVTFLAADVASLVEENSTIEKTLDGVFSTATFHWVLDHDQLFQNLFRALRPGGWVHAQCGSAGNLARLLQRIETLIASSKYRQFFDGYRSPWTYADAATTAERLRRAGFVDVETSIEAAPARFENAGAFREFVETAIVRSYLQRIPDEQLRHELLDELTELAAKDDPPFELDYWRLNLHGTRPR